MTDEQNEPMTPEQHAEALKIAAQWGLDPTDYALLPSGGRSRIHISLSGLEKLRDREEDPELRARMNAEIERRKVRFQEKMDAMQPSLPKLPFFDWRMAVCFVLLLSTGFVAGWRLHGGKSVYESRQSFEAGFKVGTLCAHAPDLAACSRESLETGGVM